MSLEEKLLILDWSGVVSDDRETVLWAMNRVFQEVGGAPITMKTLCANYGNVSDIKKNFGVDITVERFWERYKFFISRAPQQPIMISGVYIVLRRFVTERVMLAVFSAHPQVELDKEAQRYGVRDLFYVFEGNIKNKTDRIKAFMQEISASREITFYAGDTTVDIVAGRAAGVVTIGVTTGYHSRDKLESAKPDHIVEALEGVIPIVLNHSPRL